MSLEGYCLRSDKEGQKREWFLELITSLYHFEHCNLNRKHENRGMLEQVVRVIDGSWIKTEYPVNSLGSEYEYVILHKILI